MLYLESEDILISIYDNSMQPVKYDFSLEAIKLYTIIFLQRDSPLFRNIGYRTPKNLQRYVPDPGLISSPYAHLYYQEKDYPYILFSQQIDGWYAFLHLEGICPSNLEVDVSDELEDEVLLIADMYKDFHVYEYKHIHNIYLKYGALWKCMMNGPVRTRQGLYYPSSAITYVDYACESTTGSWDHSEITACSRHTLLTRISDSLPIVFGEIELDDTCFIAGGFLSVLSVETRFEEYSFDGFTRSDIDLFVVRGTDDGYTKLKKIISTLRRNGYTVELDSGFTFTAKKDDSITIQICPISYVNLMDVIDNFDTSCTAIAYNGKEVFATDNFKKYIQYGISYCKFDHMRRSRYNKYINYGFKLSFPTPEYMIEDDKPMSNVTSVTTDQFIETCFDDNLFTYSNHKDATIYHPYHPSSWLERFQVKDLFNEDELKYAVDLSNNLADSYFDNTVMDKATYDNVVSTPGNSSIDFYLYDSPSYPYYIGKGLKNDIALNIFVRCFTYAGCI